MLLSSLTCRRDNVEVSLDQGFEEGRKNSRVGCPRRYASEDDKEVLDNLSAHKVVLPCWILGGNDAGKSLMDVVVVLGDPSSDAGFVVGGGCTIYSNLVLLPANRCHRPW